MLYVFEKHMFAWVDKNPQGYRRTHSFVTRSQFHSFLTTATPPASCGLRRSAQIAGSLRKLSRDGHLLTSSMVQSLLEQLTGLQLVKKFLAFHGTRRFITALTSVRHLSLTWASPIQSI